MLSNDRIVICDPGNGRLQVFDRDRPTEAWPVVRGGFQSGSPLWWDRNDNVYVFDFKAPFKDLHVSRDGRIWVQVAQPSIEEDNPDYDPKEEGSEPKRWREPVAFDVFGEDGTYFGRVHTPDGFSTSPTPFIDGDYVWAVTRDELGVQRVVRFKVEVDQPEADL